METRIIYRKEQGPKKGKLMNVHGISLKISLALSVLTTLLFSGCAMIGLHQDLALLKQAVEIRGCVTVSPAAVSPVFVALYKATADKPTLQAYWIAYETGDFQFLAPPGDYYVLAFEDKNENAAYERDERVGWYGKPSILHAESGSSIEDITLALRMPKDAREELPQLFASTVPSVPMAMSTRHLGTVVPLDDERLSGQYAHLGLWEPVKFMENPSGGLFFLEPYSETRIPVLFVHGAGGFPQQWSTVIKSLDRTRFQPWVFYYPSGFRLDLVGTALANYLRELQATHGFDQMCVVAHSMGGLVSRDAINHCIANNSPFSVKLFVTLATPWQGHRAAALGVEHSPAVIPSWYDMSPQSPFLKKLTATPLPPDSAFALLFGYRGSSRRNGDLTDGSVFLSSVLDETMQRSAVTVRGFEATHVSILQNEKAILTLNELLQKYAHVEE